VGAGALTTNGAVKIPRAAPDVARTLACDDLANRPKEHCDDLANRPKEHCMRAQPCCWGRRQACWWPRLGWEACMQAVPLQHEA
jgi:hypothetical protein